MQPGEAKADSLRVQDGQYVPTWKTKRSHCKSIRSIPTSHSYSMRTMIYPLFAHRRASYMLDILVGRACRSTWGRYFEGTGS